MTSYALNAAIMHIFTFIRSPALSFAERHSDGF